MSRKVMLPNWNPSFDYGLR